MDGQLPDDGLKWFGEGFDGFPRRLPDDCVEYIVHVIDEKLDSPSATWSRLNEILKAANDLKKKLLKNYIWQRGAFELNLRPKIDLSKPAPPQTSKVPPHLHGRTDFGDSVADEWLVVYLLHELSKQFPDAWIRVYDTDGEFLLIEAANALPKWLNPEIAENRVWLNATHLKIVPLDNNSPPCQLTALQALARIRDQPDTLLAEPTIEKEAFHRLREYPSAVSSSLHHALLTIPRKLAYILHRNPAFVSPAIEAFYLRDPVSLKPLSTKDLATLSFAPEDFVTVSIRFTRVGYAQLRSQLFDPPPAWTGVIPRMRDDKVATGMKLASGFEMLIADPQNQSKRAVQEIKLLLEDVQSGDETLPTDSELEFWPKIQEDEKWLDIDYNDFENELSGKTDKEGTKKGFGDQGAQENLRKLVERFQGFMEQDGEADDLDDMDDDNSDSTDDDRKSVDDEGEASTVEKDFETAMKETRAMQESQIQESGLLDEARKLAVADAEDESGVDEDEEMRKIIETMEQELKGEGALDLGDGKIRRTKPRDKGKGKSHASRSVDDTASIDARGNPYFGPERPPHMQSKENVSFEDSDEELRLGDGELSSDDEEFNDVDLGLAKNILESFKGQAGMAGPTGNLMKALGVNLPRDEDSD